MNKMLLTLPIRNNALIFVFLLVFSLIALCLILANPGYFSHDEFQKLDHILSHGFADYFGQYVRITPGDSFGTPVRPLAFLVQGVLAFAMDDFPILVHFAAIAMHTLVAYLFFRAIIQMGGPISLALLAAILFCVNPMTVLATAWSAAIMDRLYVMFGLLAFLAAIQFVRKEGKSFYLLLVFSFSALALFSKETAIILPGLLVVFLITDFGTIKQSRFWLAMAAWTLPVLAFLLVRLPAIFASFGDPKVAAYKASFSNVPEGLLVYVAYPFLPTLTEAQNWVFQSAGNMAGAIAMHAILLIAIYKAIGPKAAASYCIFYLLFLVPVLLIPIKAAHYLYGSGLVVSLAFAVLIIHGRKSFAYRFIALLGIGILLAHTVALQLFAYRLGTCMSRAGISTESVYLSNDSPASVDFQALPGAPEHVLHRLFTGRNQIGNVSPVNLSISRLGTPVGPNVLSVTMNARCIVVKASAN